MFEEKDRLMANFPTANGIDHLKQMIDESASKQPILYQQGDITAVVVVDKAHTLPIIYYNDLAGRPATSAFQKQFPQLRDVYQLRKQAIIQETLENGRMDVAKKNEEDAFREITSGIEKNAWKVESVKVSKFSLFSADSPSLSSPQEKNRP